MSDDRYTEARHQLHATAEWLLAGPQYAASRTLRLQVAQNEIMTALGL